MPQYIKQNVCYQNPNASTAKNPFPLSRSAKIRCLLFAKLEGKQKRFEIASGNRSRSIGAMNKKPPAVEANAQSDRD